MGVHRRAHVISAIHDLGVDWVLDVPVTRTVQHLPRPGHQHDLALVDLLEPSARALHPHAMVIRIPDTAMTPHHVGLPGHHKGPAALGSQGNRF
jgi:hypothetical protein